MKDAPAPIVITERDVEPETLTCVNLEKNIWIKRGFPRNTDTGIVDREIMKNLSGPPYVFRATELVLIDNAHPQGATLHDVQIIFMHGGRQEGKAWMFSSIEDGYPVVETVEGVNEYLRKRGESPIQVVLACNYSDTSDNIKVGDFPAHSGITYAVGETVGLAAADMSENTEIRMTAIANDFWGLDELLVEQQIVVHNE